MPVAARAPCEGNAWTLTAPSFILCTWVSVASVEDHYENISLQRLLLGACRATSLLLDVGSTRLCFLSLLSLSILFNPTRIKACFAPSLVSAWSCSTRACLPLVRRLLWKTGLTHARVGVDGLTTRPGCQLPLHVVPRAPFPMGYLFSCPLNLTLHAHSKKENVLSSFNIKSLLVVYSSLSFHLVKCY